MTVLLRLDAHVGRGDDDRQVRVGYADAAEQLHPVGVGEPPVEHGDVRLILVQLLQRLGTGGSEDQIVPRPEGSLVAEP